LLGFFLFCFVSTVRTVLILITTIPCDLYCFDVSARSILLLRFSLFHFTIPFRRCIGVIRTMIISRILYC
jgi:hypothetical protein